MKIDFGISILNYNSSVDAFRCVDSTIDTLEGEYNYHIVVVDNCSSDNSYETLSKKLTAEKYKKICSCIKTEKNGGFAYGNNRGIDYLKAMGAKYIIVSNADVIFKKNSIQRIIEGLKTHSDTVIYAPTVYDNEGNITALPWKKAQSFLQYLGLRDTSENLFSAQELERNNPTEVYMVSGCCYGINVEKFKSMGAFDENTFLYHEEGTVGQAALRCRYKTYIDTEAKIIHNHGASTGSNNMFCDTELIMSGLYYWRKYENASMFRLLVLWSVFTLKIILKFILKKYRRRVDKREFSDSIKRTWNRFIEMKDVAKMEDVLL